MADDLTKQRDLRIVQLTENVKRLGLEITEQQNKERRAQRRRAELEDARERTLDRLAVMRAEAAGFIVGRPVRFPDHRDMRNMLHGEVYGNGPSYHDPDEVFLMIRYLAPDSRIENTTVQYMRVCELAN